MSDKETTRIVIGALICLVCPFFLPTGVALLLHSSRLKTIALWNTVGILLFGLGPLIALILAIIDAVDYFDQRKVPAPAQVSPTL